MRQAGEQREVNLAELVPHPSNYRAHPAPQVERLQESLARYGQYRPVVVQAGTNRILAGHGVVQAAKAAGEETIAATVVECDDATALAILVEDNESTYGAEDDRTALAELLADLGEARPPSFPDDRVEDLLREVTMPRMGDVEEDDPPEPQAEAVSRTGDLWLLGEAHRLLCGDCTVAADVEKLVGGGERAAMCWTDPPYGVGYCENARRPKYRHDRIPIANDALDDEGMAKLWADALTLAATVSTGDLYVAAPPGPPLTILDDTVRDRTPYERHSWLVWVKHAFVLGGSNYHYRHEQILYGWPKGKSSSWAAGRDQDSVFEVDRPMRSEEHPTMKPVALVAQMVENSSRAGDGVYDPFLGSGTTLIACEQLGRRCYGIEIEPRYVDVAIRRWQTLTGQEAILEATGRTFAQEENSRLHG